MSKALRVFGAGIYLFSLSSLSKHFSLSSLSRPVFTKCVVFRESGEAAEKQVAAVLHEV